MIVSQSPRGWIALAISQLDEVLLDHAHCEKKAAASAMSLVAGYPQHENLVLRLSALAIEELQHFRAVYERIRQRGLSLGRDPGDPYAARLLSLARAMPHEARLVDRLLLFGLIEARSHERLALLGEHLEATEPELASFYRQLSNAEARHAELFRELARELAPNGGVDEREAELAQQEAQLVLELPVLPRIH